jgi:hypothetical protein
MEVARAEVLVVRDRRRIVAGYPRYRVEQARDVALGGVEAGAGPDSSWYLAAIAAAYLVTEAAHFLPGQAEEPHQVGMRAEAAMSYADRLLRGQPRGDQRVRHALDGERGDRQRLGIGIWAQQADTGNRG